MKPKKEVGFTIIETMLFLGITGLMVLGILAGTGVSINIQRYRDSVSSLQAILQQQFSDVMNASNGSDGNLACYGDGSIKARGQSDCVLLGRFITTSNDSKTLLIKNVIGFINDDLAEASNDMDALKQYNIKISPISSDSYNIPWDAAIVSPGSNNPMSFSMLIIHSPLSGVIRSFVSNNSSISDSDIASLVNKTALTQTAKLCVSSNSLFTGVKSAVVVTANATSSSNIETQGDISGC